MAPASKGALLNIHYYYYYYYYCLLCCCFNLQQTILHEDVKEKFKYEVDRSLPSNKLREFMDWSKDIMDDIKYMQKVRANPFSRYLVKFW